MTMRLTRLWISPTGKAGRRTDRSSPPGNSRRPGRLCPEDDSKSIGPKTAMVPPMYIAESPHPRVRGGVVSRTQLSIMLGILSFRTGSGLSGLGENAEHD